MLTHFHYFNKSVIPFYLTYDAKGLSDLAKAADLSDEQVAFMRQTSVLVNDARRGERICLSLRPSY